MVGGMGQQGAGLNQVDATKLYLANSSGNTTTTDMLQCPGQDMGEKVLNYVKLLASGQIGNSGVGSSQAGGFTGQGSFVDQNGQPNANLSQLLQGGGMFSDGTSGMGGGLGTSGVPGMGGSPGYSQNMSNGIGNFLGM